jgi:4-amino-4-deoxy-L-arabinose transferase-like glycosyltransferase
MKPAQPIVSGLFAAWRWWLPPALLALALAIVFRDPFVGDWDAMDYTMLAVRGEPSSMALGRMLFTGYNHGLWRLAHAAFGLSAENAYLLFQFVIILQAPLAVWAAWALAREVSEDDETATLAALLVGTSTIFVLYAGQVMTEIPSLLVTACALLVCLRGARARRLGVMWAGAALLGLGVNLRETVAFFATWLLLAPLAEEGEKGRKEEEETTPSGVTQKLRRLFSLPPSFTPPLLVSLSPFLPFLLFAFGPFALWFGLDVGNYRAAWFGWLATMRDEAARHPLSWRNLGPFIGYFALASPLIFVAWPAATWREWRERGLTARLALALTGLLATCLLFFNYSTVINPRYFLSGLPALAPLVAAYGMRRARLRGHTETRAAFRQALWGVGLLAALSLALLATRLAYIRPLRLMTKNYLSALAQLPPDAVIMSGANTVAVTYWRGVGAGRWETIGTGSGWPGDQQLVPVVERHLNDGRRVFLDANPSLWMVCGWQAHETRTLPVLEQHFRFRRAGESLYEVRPLTDATAQDAPRLSDLQPENRPAEARLCLKPSG